MPRLGMVLELESVSVTVRRVSRKRVEEVLVERTQRKEEAGQ